MVLIDLFICPSGWRSSILSLLDPVTEMGTLVFFHVKMQQSQLYNQIPMRLTWKLKIIWGIFNISEHLQFFPNLKTTRVIKSDYLIGSCMHYAQKIYIFSLVGSNRTQRNRIKLHRGDSGWTPEWIFSERLVTHWNRLPRHMVTAPRLAELKENLNNIICFNSR